MREIKFEFIYKGLPYSAKNNSFNYHARIYTLKQLIDKPLIDLCHFHATCELIAKRQYTGLLDKNGAEIYEGDLIELHGIKNGCVLVAFKNSYTGGWILSEDRDLKNYISLGARSPDEIEVIGNIYENGELFEVSQ